MAQNVQLSCCISPFSKLLSCVFCGQKCIFGDVSRSGAAPPPYHSQQLHNGGLATQKKQKTQKKTSRRDARLAT